MNRKVFLKNLGCPKNEIDGNLMASYLEQIGCKMVDSPENADLLIVNTCGFITEAKEESIEEIFELARVKTAGEGKKLVVSGCLAQRYKEELAAGIPEVDHFLGICDLKNIRSIVGSDNGTDGFTGKLTRRYQKHDVLPLRSKKSYAYLRISDGCDNHCSYCAIPQIRGRFRSRPVADILREASQLATDGFRELILIGQDTTMYGTDIYGKRRLSDLIGFLSELDKRFVIRVMYAHPKHVDDRLISMIASNDQVIPYIDLPIQHISDRMLKLMGRKVTSKTVRRLVARLRETVPGITIRTTYLLGHPGESTADFEKLLRFQEEFNIERVGVFGYSAEEGTRSFRLNGRVRESTIARRIDAIMDLVQEQSLVRNHALVGTVQDMLVDGPADSGRVWARMLSQAPEIDGSVLLSGVHRIGTVVKGRILSAEAYDLYAADA
jgi:ribosomal protein S12 methylthiotransferase